MATISISQLDTATQAKVDDLYEVAVVDENSQTGYASRKLTAAQIATLIAQGVQFSGLSTEAKTIIAAINEAAQNGGTEVEPNPTGEPTGTLEKIGIDGTIYDLPSGISEPVSKTVTGNPINITDAANAPIVSGTVEFEPKQDLHGYNKPWVWGAGKNKLPLVLAFMQSANTGGTWSGNVYTTNGATFTVNLDSNNNVISITVKGNPSADIMFITSYYEGELYDFTLNGCPSGGSVSTYKLTPNGNFASDEGSGVSVPETSAWNRYVSIYIYNGLTIPTDGYTFYPMIRLATETDPTFEPYENICPIEGYTDCEVEVTGKNLLPLPAEGTKNGITLTHNADGSVTLTGTATSTTYFDFFEGDFDSTAYAGYIFRAYTEYTGWGANTMFFRISGADRTGIQNFTGNTDTAIADNGSELYFALRVANGYSIPSGGVTIYPMLRNSTETATFEPYKDRNYTINLDETRHGGEIDVKSGVMRVTTGYIASYAGETIGEPWLSDRDEYVAGTTPSTGAEVVYTLATPQEVQLTPEQIRTLEGTNNISTNMTDMSLEYITQDYQPLVKLIERSAGHHYSTDEHVIGTWIDGKPLYEKTVVFENQQLSVGSNTLPLGITNTDLIFPVGVYITNSSKTNIRPLNSYDTGTNNESLFYRILTNTREIDIQAGVVWSSPDIYITLQYTKTTD